MLDIWGKESCVMEQNALLEIAASESAVEILLIASEPFSGLLSAAAKDSRLLAMVSPIAPGLNLAADKEVLFIASEQFSSW